MPVKAIGEAAIAGGPTATTPARASPGQPAVSSGSSRNAAWGRQRPIMRRSRETGVTDLLGGGPVPFW
jgi:hypothetical protein